MRFFMNASSALGLTAGACLLAGAAFGQTTAPLAEPALDPLAPDAAMSCQERLLQYEAALPAGDPLPGLDAESQQLVGSLLQEARASVDSEGVDSAACVNALDQVDRLLAEAGSPPLTAAPAPVPAPAAPGLVDTLPALASPASAPPEGPVRIINGVPTLTAPTVPVNEPVVESAAPEEAVGAPLPADAPAAPMPPAVDAPVAPPANPQLPPQ